MASPIFFFGLVWFWGFLAIAEVGGEDIAVAEVMLSLSPHGNTGPYLRNIGFEL